MKLISICENKEHILVDLDATLARYTKFKGKTVIGEPIPKMVQRVKRALARGKNIKIFTARADDEESIQPIKDWCKQHLGKVLPITNVKDRWCREIWDDRARRVRKNTGEFMD